MPSVFLSYSHVDEELCAQLEKQLAMLRRQGVIEIWHDRRIEAGQEFATAIDEHVNSDEIILLLVSPDFIASDYCYDIEMQRAMERHNDREAVVIPVILRPCDWAHAPFGKLNATPKDGKPVTQWPDKDVALLQVAQAVREVATRLQGKGSSQGDAGRAPAPAQKASTNVVGPRSSNLRLTKTFTQLEKDRFQLETFEYVAKYFENSLSEMEVRNPGFQGVFRRVDATRFFAAIYKNGKDVARATIFSGGNSFGHGINYMHGETMGSNSTNESLSVEADDQALYFTSMGMSSFGSDRDQKLSQEGAAELLWEMLIAPLQQGGRW